MYIALDDKDREKKIKRCVLLDFSAPLVNTLSFSSRALRKSSRNAEQANPKLRHYVLVPLGQQPRPIPRAPPLAAQRPLHGGLGSPPQRSLPVAPGGLQEARQGHGNRHAGSAGCKSVGHQIQIGVQSGRTCVRAGQGKRQRQGMALTIWRIYRTRVGVSVVALAFEKMRTPHASGRRICVKK